MNVFSPKFSLFNTAVFASQTNGMLSNYGVIFSSRGPSKREFLGGHFVSHFVEDPIPLRKTGSVSSAKRCTSCEKRTVCKKQRRLVENCVCLYNGGAVSVLQGRMGRATQAEVSYLAHTLKFISIAYP